MAMQFSVDLKETAIHRRANYEVSISTIKYL